MLEDEKVKILYKSVKERYFNGNSITANDFNELTEFLGNVYFVIPAILWLQDRIRRVTSPSYFCKFSYVGNEKTPTDLLVKRQASGDYISFFLKFPIISCANNDLSPFFFFTIINTSESTTRKCCLLCMEI